MTRIGGYPTALIPRDFYRRPFVRKTEWAAYPSPDAVLPAIGPAESRFPSLLGILTGIFYATTVSMSGSTWKISWVPQLVAVLLAICWVVVGVCLQGHRLRWSWAVTSLLLFAAWTATGFLVTPNLDYFITDYITLLKVCAITWICLQTVRTRRDLLVCFLFLGFTSIIVLYQGIDAIIKSVEVAGVRGVKGARAGTDLMTNANALGQLGTVTLVGAIACIMCQKNLIVRIIAIGFSIACLYIIAASGSRMAMLAVVFFAASIYWFHFRKSGSSTLGRRIFIMFFAVFLVVGSVLFLTKLPFFFRLKEAFESKENFEKEPRVEYFFRAVDATMQHPVLGLGMGGFALARLGTTAKGQGHFSHSSISETLACTGIPGFLIYFASLAAMFKIIRTTRKLPMPPADKTLMDIMMSLFPILVLFNVVAIMYQDRMLWPFTGAVLGYVGYIHDRYTGAPLAPATA